MVKTSKNNRKRTIAPGIDRKRAGKAPRQRGKHPGGKPTQYDEDRYPHIAFTVCARLGANNKALAKVFGIELPTLAVWKVTYPDFKKAVQEGKDVYDSRNVEVSYLQRALGYDYDEVTINEKPITNKDEQLLEVVKLTKTTNKRVLPDVKAAEGWLRLRNPKRWGGLANTGIDVKQTGQIDHRHAHLHKLDLSNIDSGTLNAIKQLAAIISPVVAQLPEQSSAVVGEYGRPGDTAAIEYITGLTPAN